MATRPGVEQRLLTVGLGSGEVCVGVCVVYIYIHALSGCRRGAWPISLRVCVGVCVVYIYILEWTRAFNAREVSWLRVSGFGLGGFERPSETIFEVEHIRKFSARGFEFRVLLPMP